jgi:transposase
MKESRSHAADAREVAPELVQGERGISEGAVEGLNNKIRVVTRRAYGSRTFNAMEITLYHSLGKLPELESTHRFC